MEKNEKKAKKGEKEKLRQKITLKTHYVSNIRTIGAKADVSNIFIEY